MHIFFRIYNEFTYRTVYWIECCLVLIFILNVLHHIIQYIWTTLQLKPIVLSPKQRPLLGVPEDDPLFREEVPHKVKTSDQSFSLNLSYINLNRRSTPLGTPVLSEIST